MSRLHRSPARGSVGVTAILLAAILLTACGGGAPAGGLTDLTQGDPLPAATLPVLGEATSIAMGDVTGPTVINFWATWCTFCVEEMPDIQAVASELDGVVRFIGVDREDSVRRALELAAETGVTYELVEDRDGDYFAAVQGRGMPTTLFVAADGTIRYRHAGPLDAAQLRALIHEHLGV